MNLKKINWRKEKEDNKLVEYKDMFERKQHTNWKAKRKEKKISETLKLKKILPKLNVFHIK